MVKVGTSVNEAIEIDSGKLFTISDFRCIIITRNTSL